ncbi:hypothetical protein [Oligoflexus tunisiensis]|uniref:hypothetical protein n=1 Tax=Oligoflexus tunisiensis TaxID=708132 RepID=UPI00114CB47D|nr:hypothetical protein [Oligoflexus tunisiensis]
MSEKKGTQETIEVLQLVLTLVELLAAEIKGDGLQWTDAVKVVMSPEFQEKLARALAGFTAIPGEVEDLSGIEMIDLAEFALRATKSVLLNIGRAA